MSEALEKFPILGIPVHLSDDYSSWLVSRLNERMGTHVVTLNSEMAIEAERNQALGKIVEQAELVIPDGSGIVLYLWLHGRRQKRCPGIELAESMLQQAGQLGESCPVFFYGGAPGVANKAAEVWQSRAPGIALAATQHGYISPEEQQQMVNTLKDLQPRVILVGLGVPRQEFWIAENRHICPQSVWIGVGGSLDIWAGVKTRAPKWLRENNLEWLYRFYKEPSRWRRMLALPLFALRALLHRLTGR